MTAFFGECKFKLKRLKYVASIKSSNVDKIITEGEQVVRLCNYVDVYYNERITNEIMFSEGSASARELNKFGLQENDVIITKDSETPDDIAVAALVGSGLERVVCGYHLALLRPRRHVIRGDFLFWCLKSRPIRNDFSTRAQGITRFGLTLDGIGNVLIPEPDFTTQALIVEFLERETARIDRMIEIVGGKAITQDPPAGSFVSLLLEAREAIITAAVTGQIDVETWAKTGTANRSPDAISPEVAA